MAYSSPSKRKQRIVLEPLMLLTEGCEALNAEDELDQPGCATQRERRINPGHIHAGFNYHKWAFLRYEPQV